LHPSRAAKLLHIAPFAAFVAILAAARIFQLPERVFYPLRVSVVLLLLLAARHYISLRPRFPLQSVIMGTAVFLIWVAPDLLFGYRHFWLFENALTGRAASTIDPALRLSLPFIVVRAAGATLLVPVFEELFWRSWLMRWLIKPRFETIPFGTYERSSFWTVAVLFAIEHGPYWEVGLAAGILYNWWAVRTRSLADCILAHAVTNGLLSAFVLFTGNWQYWS
jgi:CAAX prenyl protease-like protein